MSLPGLMVFGITGRANAGKNETARLLGATHIIEFAEPLYRMISAMTDIPVWKLKDRAFKEQVIPWLGKSPRQLLQTLGTDWGRDMICPDVWIRIAKQKIAGAIVETQFCSRPTIIALPDLRFDNEAEMLIEEFGAVILETVRPDASTCAAHVSEAGISRHLISKTLVNGGSLDDFREVVRSAVASLPNGTMKNTMGGDYRDGRIQGCAG
jgi:hypothetical protein